MRFAYQRERLEYQGSYVQQQATYSVLIRLVRWVYSEGRIKGLLYWSSSRRVYLGVFFLLFSSLESEPGPMGGSHGTGPEPVIALEDVGVRRDRVEVALSGV